jgi:hypothetical protein
MAANAGPGMQSALSEHERDELLGIFEDIQMGIVADYLSNHA